MARENTQQKNQTMTTSQVLAKAEQLLASEQWRQAGTLYQKLTQHQPTLHAAWHGLGVVSHKAGNNEQAFSLMAKAITLKPDISLYHRNIGELFRITHQLDKAVEAGNNACKLAPKDPQAHYHLALAYADKQDHSQTIQCYRQAIALKPNHCMALNNLGSLFSQQGDFDNARQCFEQAINANPRFADSFYNLSPLKTFSADDPQLALMEELSKTSETLPANMQVRLWFALGKAREDSEQYDAAFEAYAKGNAIQHQLMPVNEHRQQHNHQQLISQCETERLEQNTGLKDPCPVFIVGMPRSGTTLVEQILSSHPQVYGAGEINDLAEAIQESGGGKPGFDIRQLDDEALSQIGRAYVQRLRQLSPDAQRITNKMPGNYAYLGLIKQILPKAKIIHVLRDPMDSCFSCYAKLFSRTLEFTYNMETLGRYYVHYREMMTHWQQCLPEGSILDVHYEDVVADFENQARRIVDYADLSWDDNCLDFHNNERDVKTASIAQVRQPIYKTSVARWEHFRKHLGPLETIVSPYRR